MTCRKIFTVMLFKLATSVSHVVLLGIIEPKRQQSQCVLNAAGRLQWHARTQFGAVEVVLDGWLDIFLQSHFVVLNEAVGVDVAAIVNGSQWIQNATNALRDFNVFGVFKFDILSHVAVQLVVRIAFRATCPCVFEKKHICIGDRRCCHCQHWTFSATSVLTVLFVSDSWPAF
jgi:hypothetical protein